MLFKTKVDDYEVTLEFRYGQPVFTCGAVSGEFDTPEKMEKAIKVYDLSLRKDFTNKTAYRSAGYGVETSIEEVEVTSVDGKEAWIRSKDGKRQKTSRAYLFAGKDEAAAAHEKIRELRKEMDAVMAAVKRWEPQK
jgi:hypothetical protein